MPKFGTYPLVTAPAPTDLLLVKQGAATKGVPLARVRNVDWFNVKDYGAVGDGVTDDWAACQAAHDAILASGRAGVLYFPRNDTVEGYYQLSQPLHLHARGLHVLGDGRSMGTRLAGSACNYPLLYVRPTTANNWPTGTALATGAGGSLTLNPATQASDPYVNWCEASVFLDGLSAFTAECFIRLTSTADGYILSSVGRIVAGDTPDSAFHLRIDAGKLRCRLTTSSSGSVDVVGTTTLSTATTYHVEMSWDGTTLRLFLNGVQEASTAAAGTLVQKAHEWGNWGAYRYSLAIGIIFECMTGALDSIRFSSVARHTTNFTPPTTKHAFDASTMILQNFDDDDVYFARCMHKNSLGESALVWLPKYGGSVGYLNYIEIGHLELNARCGQGIWIYSSWQTYFHDLYTTGGVIGINCAQDQFNSTFERLELIDLLGAPNAPGGRFGFLGQFNVGETFTAISTAGFHYPFALLGAGSGNISGLYTHGDSDIPVVLIGATNGNAFQLIGALLSNEDVTVAQRTLVAVSTVPGFTVVGGNFEAWATAKPAFLISGGHSHVFINPNVRLHASATEAIQIAAVPTHTPRLIGGAKQDTPAIPWSLGTVTEL